MQKKPKISTEFKEGRGYTREDWDIVSDNPELTEEDFKLARPFAEVFPELAASIARSRGRPSLESPKKQVTLRLDADLIARYKASGKGWQSRINDDLRKVSGL
ncbi:MAG: hypothetical protein JWL86_5278 [Rhizobium sp.]|nr:hypothetical protein [Rhizobium sp.]